MPSRPSEKPIGDDDDYGGDDNYDDDDEMYDDNDAYYDDDDDDDDDSDYDDDLMRMMMILMMLIMMMKVMRMVINWYIELYLPSKLYYVELPTKNWWTDWKIDLPRIIRIIAVIYLRAMVYQNKGRIILIFTVR